MSGFRKIEKKFVSKWFYDFSRDMANYGEIIYVGSGPGKYTTFELENSTKNEV
jgi:hypothetical protein